MLGAHFLRDGTVVGVAAAFVFIGLLLLRRPWVARIAQAALVAAAVVWVATLYDVAEARMALGLPWLRMAIILGSVAALALLSALVFQTKSLRDVYRLD